MASPLVLPSIRSLFPTLPPTSRPYWDPVRHDAALPLPAGLSTISDNESDAEHTPDADIDVSIDVPEHEEQQPSTPSRRRGRDVRGPRARKFPCDICPSVFERPSSLDQHKRSHTGEKPFSCDICGKRFSVSSNARRHDRTCHAEVVAERERLRLDAVAALRAGPAPPSLTVSSSSPMNSVLHFPHSTTSPYYQPRRLHLDTTQTGLLVDEKYSPKHAKDELSDPSLRVLVTTKASYPNEMEVDVSAAAGRYGTRQHVQVGTPFMLTELEAGLEDVKQSVSTGGKNHRVVPEQSLCSSRTSFSIPTSAPPSMFSWSSSPSRSISPCSASSSSEEPISPISSRASSSPSSPAMRNASIKWSLLPHSNISSSKGSSGR